MIKHSQFPKNQTQPKPKKEGSLSVFDFFRRAKETAMQKSEVALNKIHHKLVEDASVFILPLQNRKRLTSQDKSPQRDDRSVSKQRTDQTSKSNGQLTQKNSERLNELMKKRQQLMLRLRKIDHELHNPSLLPVTNQQSSNNSFLQNDFQKIQGFESRIQAQQKNTYNVVQHGKTVEMLMRINNDKMRRQEKIVNEMKKKQEKEMKKLEEVQKNKSKIQFSRQSRVLPALKSINKRETERLQDSEEAEPSQRPFYSQPREKEESNEFQEIEDRRIGYNERTPTESNEQNTIQNSP